jgi:hypothetical protein
MNHFLSKFCDFEKKSMEMRKSLIQNFEDAIAEVDTALDLSSFVESKKAPELTHKYSKVLSFLDWNYDQKQ